MRRDKEIRLEQLTKEEIELLKVRIKLEYGTGTISKLYYSEKLDNPIQLKIGITPKIVKDLYGTALTDGETTLYVHNYILEKAMFNLAFTNEMSKQERLSQLRKGLRIKDTLLYNRLMHYNGDNVELLNIQKLNNKELQKISINPNSNRYKQLWNFNTFTNIKELINKELNHINGLKEFYNKLDKTVDLNKLANYNFEYALDLEDINELKSDTFYKE